MWTSTYGEIFKSTLVCLWYNNYGEVKGMVGKIIEKQQEKY